MEPEFRTIRDASTNALILNAKHNSDHSQRLECGRELVGRMTENGEFGTLLLISRDEAFHPDTRDAASLNILSAVFNRCRRDGHFGAMFDAASDSGMPSVVKLHAGAALIQRIAKGDEGALSRIVRGASFHQDIRLEAGHALLALLRASGSFTGVFSLATEGEVPYGVKKAAGHVLIEMAVESGNYPILLRLSREKLPMDLIVAMEGKVPEAAFKAIEAAALAGDRCLLGAIESDARLDAAVRQKASMALGGPTSPAHAYAPDPAMASEMVRRLGRPHHAPAESPSGHRTPRLLKR